MASSEEVSFISEWECDEEYEEEKTIESGEGEEADRSLSRNDRAWNSCDKLRADANYHQRYIILNDALAFRGLSTEDKEAFIKDKRLTEEEKIFLSSEQAVKCLKDLSDAVVCITVKQSISSQIYGTGFFVHFNGEDAVMTNSHTLRSLISGNGIDFRLVKPDNVRVFFFHNGNDDVQVTRKVDRIENASLPEKNQDRNILLSTMKRALLGGGTINTVEMRKCNDALVPLSKYFDVAEAFLDFALLFLKPLEDEKQKAMFAKIIPLEMKPFKILDNFRNVSPIEIPDPMSSTYSRSLRIFTMSHPHRASKQVSFGGMESNLFHLYNLNRTFGQNDKEILDGKEPFAEHSIATCRGSSGAPIFIYIVNHDTCEVDVDKAVYFLHFYGGKLEGKFHGKAVSVSTIIKNLKYQEFHNKLAGTFAEVRKHGKPT